MSNLKQEAYAVISFKGKEPNLLAVYPDMDLAMIKAKEGLYNIRAIDPELRIEVVGVIVEFPYNGSK